jgi:hypothetical protein
MLLLKDWFVFVSATWPALLAVAPQHHVALMQIDSFTTARSRALFILALYSQAWSRFKAMTGQEDHGVKEKALRSGSFHRLR